MLNKITISTIKKSNGRTYLNDRDFHLTNYGMSEDSWLYTVLIRMSDISKNTPYYTSEVDLLIHIAVGLENNIQAFNLMRTPISKIKRADMHVLFTCMENHIIFSTTWSPAVQARASMSFRRWMTETIGIDENVTNQSYLRYELMDSTCYYYPSPEIEIKFKKTSDIYVANQK